MKCPFKTDTPYISIRLKLIAAFSVMIIPIFLLGYISSRLAYKTIEDRAILSTRATIDQSAKLLDIIFDNVKDEYIKILASSQIQDYIRMNNDDDRTILLGNKLSARANNYLTGRVLSSAAISNIWMFSGDKKTIGTKMLPLQFNYRKLRDSGWYKRGEDIRSSLAFNGFHPGLEEERNELSYALSLTGSIKKITADNFINETSAVMVIDIDLDYISKILKGINIGNGGEIHLVSADGRDLITGQNNIKKTTIDSTLASYISNGNSNESNMVSYKDNKYLMVFREIGKTGLIIIGLQPESEIISTAKRINRITFYLIIFAFVTALVLGLVITLGIGSRISRFSNIMSEVAGGNLDITIKDSGNDEIAILGKSFNKMISDLKRYVNESVENEKIKREMQVNLLISHINPHMIYNTLNSVIYLARENKNKDIEKMVEAFISLLQNSIKIGDEGIFATVGQEIESVKNYELIQHYRYPDKFKIFWDVDNNLLNERVPKTILQPLVENALFHGICPLDRKGVIRISIRKNAGGVIILVADDGVGIDQDKIKSILQEETVDPMSKGVKSIGLFNIRERLKYLYRGYESMKIYSIPREKTVIELFIPSAMKMSQEKVQLS